MAALDTVEKYVTSARVLLQDTVTPYRYPDVDLVLALTFAIYEARRIRPDLFVGRYDDLPTFTVNDSTEVDIDEQYRMAVLYYIVGQAQLRDDEPTQDARSSALINSFRTAMIGQL